MNNKGMFNLIVVPPTTLDLRPIADIIYKLQNCICTNLILNVRVSSSLHPIQLRSPNENPPNFSSFVLGELQTME